MNEELVVFKERTSNSLTKENRVTKEGVMKGVHLIGLIGKSNKAPGAIVPYKYKESAIKTAVANKVYEGADSYFGHSKDDGSARDPRDRAGIVLRDVVTYKEGVGAIGDIQLDVKHPHYESLVWWANNHPDRVMMSHEAKMKYNRTENAIEEIISVESVDFVIEGNTTTALFKEGVLRDKITADDKARELNRIIETFQSVCWTTIYPMSSYSSSGQNKVLTQEEKAVLLTPIAQDLVKELKAIGSGSAKESVTKENDMDLKTLTLADLAKDRPDLVVAIATDTLAKEAVIVAKVSEAVKDIPAEKRSATFLKLVKEAIVKNDTALLAELVDDRAKLVKESVTSTVVKAETNDEILAREAKAKGAATELTDEQIVALANK